MASPVSSYDEEGEIFESDAEKAPPSLPSVSGPSVDRPSIRLPARASTSPQDPPTSTSRYNDHRYDRRTPNNNDGYQPRGEKRRRSREDDARSHRVHYEAGARDVSIRRPRVSYADIDRGDTQTFRDELSDDHFGVDSNRSRTRSRSPPPRGSRPDRGGRGGGGGGGGRYYDDRRRDGLDGHFDGRNGRYGGYGNGGRQRSNDRSRGERRENPASFDRARRDAETRSKDSDRHGGREAKYARPSGNERSTNCEDDKKSAKEPKLAIEEPVDEAKLIEERRKKREAIKAKYRGQGTPMLATALGIKDTPAASPSDSTGPNSPSKPSLGSSSRAQANLESKVTPRSPPDLTPGGVFTLAKQGAAAEPDAELDAADEPSAADYDPTLDMREDQKRNEQRLHKNEVSSGAYDEMKTTDRDVLMREADAPANPEPEKPKAEGENDFDMFAEGDDDDMFAPASATTDQEPGTTPKPVATIEAKQLDAGLLDNWDDDEGYYKMIPGELMDGRYKVQMSLGKGMFSGVVRARDMTTNKDSAIKIIRNNETMRKAGMKEIDILKKLAEADPEDKKHVVRLERYFEHKGHLCIVFENLNINLRDVLKKSGIRDVGISLNAVRAYAHQMFLGLSLLRKCNILHADLKPDNVLVSESQNVLKICDLGSASDASENDITQYLVSRFYRAPEIILGMSYDFAIDMWSIGCTLYELYTGKILFTGRTNNQMLRSIMECRGKFSNKLLRKGQFTPLHFDEMGNFRSVEKDKITGKDVVRTINYTKPTRELKQRLLSAASGSETELKELNLFVDLLERCLNLNPERRCTPDEALKHPFIRRPVPSAR